MSAQIIQTLWNYNFWAQDRVFEALDGFSEDEFAKDLGDGNGSVRDKLAHIRGAEDVWVRRIQGDRSPSFPPASIYDSMASFRKLSDETRNTYKTLVSGLTDTGLSEKISYVNLKGVEFTTPLQEILLHVANHGTYHRGQVASLIRRIKGKPPVTDLIEYFRQIT